MQNVVRPHFPNNGDKSALHIGAISSFPPLNPNGTPGSPCCKPEVSRHRHEKDGEDFLEVVFGEPEGYMGAKPRAHYKTGSDPHGGNDLYEAMTIVVPRAPMRRT